LSEWQDRFVPPATFDPNAEAFGMKVIRSHPLNVSAIVGGFIEDNTMFFCAKGMTHIQSESSPGIHAIGSGSIPAMNRLNVRGQNLGYSLARTALHAHEAMLDAHQQESRTVGPPANYLVITKGQPVLYLPSDSELLRRWTDHYAGRDSSPLDSDASNLAIQAELRPVAMPPYDVSLPKNATS
jgi:hypothetical protein